jgi:phosphate acyltransferase
MVPPKTTPIAVDALGGDYAPHAVIVGVLRAAQAGVPILLCGYNDLLIESLDKLNPTWRKLPIDIEPCTEHITMAEEPSRAVMHKKDASLVRAAHAVKAGQASGLVSAGNSGAVLAVGTLIIGRIPGVLRPAIGNFVPTPAGDIFCLDLGATTDCKVEYLVQFAHLGTAYVQIMRQIQNPRVALLSNGHEPYKGSVAVKEAYYHLEKAAELNFVGNVEARDLFEGKADVLVMDGFAGNVLLKGVQGTIGALFTWIKKEAQQSIVSRLAAFCAKPLFKAIRKLTDYQQVGGALLLGVKRPIIVAHGCSQADGIYNAILFAHKIAQSGRFEQLVQYTMLQFTHKEADRAVTANIVNNRLNTVNSLNP